jgi:PIN domain nuclease of toxin-antitoxin system
LILLDTQVLVFDALQPARLSRRAREALESGYAEGTLACSDISLWEIAMLVARRRVEIDRDAESFIADVVTSRGVRVLPITPEIAALAQSAEFGHGDPADRIIAATALAERATLVSADVRLRKLRSLQVVW